MNTTSTERGKQLLGGKRTNHYPDRLCRKGEPASGRLKAAYGGEEKD